LGAPSPLSTRQADIEGDGRLSWWWFCDGAQQCPRDGSNRECACQVYDSNGPQAGTCGSKTGSLIISVTPPQPPGLCWSPTLDDNQPPVSVPALVSGNPPRWVWSCPGTNGGPGVTCGGASYPGLVKGQCGTAAGKTYAGPPVMSVELCAAGTPTSVQQREGLWVWTCQSSVPGVADARCSATMANPPVNGQCGAADGTSGSSSPFTSGSAALCAAGTEVGTTGTGPWSWDCVGRNGGSTAHCAQGLLVPTITDGVCGFANGTAQTSAPSGSALCAAGTASVVTGTGPWSWQCQGQNGGATAACSAALFTNGVPVTGVCGPASGTTIPDQPNANLCASGWVESAPTYTGGGWTWICSGSNGGASSSLCSAGECTACAGSVTAPQATAPFTMNIGGQCDVTAYAVWTETDVISPVNNGVTISWANDPLIGGMFTRPVMPVAAGKAYCPPCYQKPQGVAGYGMVIRAVKTGTCPQNAALDAGQTLTLPGSNASVK
jgi:hypothetical protein